MNNFKNTKVVMLPTIKSNKVGDIVMRPSDKRLTTINVLTTDDPQECINQHIYILSDDEIKENDLPCWCISDLVNSKPFECTNLIYAKQYSCKKIIAATELLCIKDNGGTANEDDYLPQPSQQFITKFIEEYNKEIKTTKDNIVCCGVLERMKLGWMKIKDGAKGMPYIEGHSDDNIKQ